MHPEPASPLPAFCLLVVATLIMTLAPAPTLADLATPASAIKAVGAEPPPVEKLTDRLRAHYAPVLPGRELPAELTISSPELREREGQVELTFLLHQQQEPPRPLELLLLLTTPSRSFSVAVTSKRTTTPIHLLLPERPSAMILDPYLDAPRRLSPAEIPPTWQAWRQARQPLAILPDGELPTAWQPLLSLFRRLKVEVRPLSAVRDQELVESAPLFLRVGRRDPARGYLAESRHAPDRITVEALANPLNPQLAAVVLSLPAVPPAAETPVADLEQLFRQLTGDGLFSRLEIADGRVSSRQLAPAAAGIKVALDREPDGLAAAQRLSFSEIMAELATVRVIHVGEVHDRYEDHLLQLRVLRAMHRQHPKVAIGMEMFPRSVQPVLDAYLAGEFDEREFLRRSEWFGNWNFDYRLYREIIDFARHHRLPIIALNLERGLTSKVFREGGISELEEDERAQLPPDRDLGLPGYRERIEAAFRMPGSPHHREKTDEAAQRRRFAGFLQAQSLWDEQMAAAMAEFLEPNPDYRLLTVVGQGHTDKENAIPPRLARRLPDVSQAVLVPVREQTAPAAAADYFLFLPPAGLPEPALLGVRIRDGREQPGALVAGVSPHSPAGRAGIKENDLLIALDDETIDSGSDLRIALLYHAPGETVTVTLLRPEGAAPPPTPDPPTQPEATTPTKMPIHQHDEPSPSVAPAYRQIEIEVQL